MKFYRYKGREVEVIRQYKVGGKSYIDLRSPSNGDVFKGLPLSFIKEGKKVVAKQNNEHKHISEKIKPKQVEAKGTPDVQKVEFIKNNKTVAEVNYPSDEYDGFVKQNKLNPVMVQNCIKGTQKSHKGFQVKLSK